MELKIRDGDYVPDNAGGFVRLGGKEALLQRVLFRLTARRGALPFLPELGSRLYTLASCPPAQRQGAAMQYVAEALAAEPGVSVTEVTLREADGLLAMEVRLQWEDETLALSLDVR